MIVRGTGSDFVIEVAGNLGTIGAQQRDQAILFLTGDHIIGRTFQPFAELTIFGHVAVRDKCHHAQARDTGLTVFDRSERAVGLLLCCQPT